MHPQQLLMPLGYEKTAYFKYFIDPLGHEHLAKQLKDWLEAQSERFLLLLGASGCGKSHLCYSAIHALEHKACFYLDLAQINTLDPQMLEGLSSTYRLIVIENIQDLKNHRPWQEALFHLYNQVHANPACQCLFSSQETIAQMDLELEDLSSRLLWPLQIQIPNPDDDLIVAILQQRAQLLGLNLEAEVADYMLRRCTRNINALLEQLESLHLASLSQKKRLSIPFVKKVLALV